jgi:hypothetical protein
MNASAIAIHAATREDNGTIVSFRMAMMAEVLDVEADGNAEGRPLYESMGFGQRNYLELGPA